MTADEMIEQALSRVGELGGEYPSTRAPMARRIGYRQRQLYEKAARINPERFGTCATAALSSGNADLSDIASPVPTPAQIQRIEVLDPGTSTYAVGAKINLVTVEDQGAEFPPRALLRDRVLIGVGSDLSLVTSIKVFYAKLPALLTGSAASLATQLELEAPWDTLLELDLSRWLVTKATAMSEDKRSVAIAAFTAEAQELEADFIAHAASYTPLVSRFDAPHTQTRVTE